MRMFNIVNTNIIFPQKIYEFIKPIHAAHDFLNLEWSVRNAVLEGVGPDSLSSKLSGATVQIIAARLVVIVS